MTLRLSMKTNEGELIDQYGRVLDSNIRGKLVPTGRCGCATH